MSISPVEYIELNMANYDEDDVAQINQWGTWAVGEIAQLRENVRLLHDATIVLRNGMGGHNHWDNTMQHGLGCETCLRQQAARDEAARLIEMVDP